MKCVVPANTAQLPKHLVVMTMIRLTFDIIWLVLCTHSKLYACYYVDTLYLDLPPKAGLALVIEDIHNLGRSFPP